MKKRRRRPSNYLLAIPALLLLLSALFSYHQHGFDEFAPKNVKVGILPMASLPPDHLLNTGDVADLDKLPGLGPTLAQNILDERALHGLFRLPEDLLNVHGIGEKRLADILHALADEPAPSETE